MKQNISLVTGKLFWLIATAIVLAAAVLRVVALEQVPPAPYWEEVALGYDAYSILRTGQDHHGNAWPIVAFESFGDWKPALYFYTVIPFIQLFGLTVFAVRLPAAVAGIGIVICTGILAYLLSDELLPQKKRNISQARTLSLLALLLTALNPWAIQFSRGAWEVNVATFFLVLGIILFILFAKNATKVWLGGAGVVFLVLSMYTYHSLRVVAPLVGLLLLSYWFVRSKDHHVTLATSAQVWLKKNVSRVILFGVVALILLTPLLFNLSSPTVTRRLAETSIFSDLTLIETSNTLREQSGDTFLARILYHRYVLFGREVINNYLSHFNLSFLFLRGDINPRHSIQFFGLFLPLDSVFLFVGLFIAGKKRTAAWLLLLGWLAVGLIPPSITTAAPHALRILPTLPVWILLLTVGVYWFFSSFETLLFKKVRWVWVSIVILFAVVYGLQFGAYWRTYWYVYPQLQSHEWQYGYAEAVKGIQDFLKENETATIYFTREKGRPAMYYWFYAQVDPVRVQAAEAEAKKTESEFLTFENLKFINTINEVTPSSGLIVSSPKQYQEFQELRPTAQIEKRFSVSDLSGTEVWVGYFYDYK